MLCFCALGVGEAGGNVQNDSSVLVTSLTPLPTADRTSDFSRGQGQVAMIQSNESERRIPCVSGGPTASSAERVLNRKGMNKLFHKSVNQCLEAATSMGQARKIRKPKMAGHACCDCVLDNLFKYFHTLGIHVTSWAKVVSSSELSGDGLCLDCSTSGFDRKRRA